MRTIKEFKITKISQATIYEKREGDERERSYPDESRLNLELTYVTPAGKLATIDVSVSALVASLLHFGKKVELVVEDE